MDYKHFIEKQKQIRRSQFEQSYFGKIANDESNENKIQSENKDDYDLSNNWVDIVNLVKSRDIPPPVFSDNGGNLGNKLLDHALEKSARTISNETNIPFREVKAKICSELRGDRVARGSAITAVRFLRGVTSDLFLVCPECGYENESDWESCKNCGTER